MRSFFAEVEGAGKGRQVEDSDLQFMRGVINYMELTDLLLMA